MEEIVVPRLFVFQKAPFSRYSLHHETVKSPHHILLLRNRRPGIGHRMQITPLCMKDCFDFSGVQHTDHVFSLQFIGLHLHIIITFAAAGLFPTGAINPSRLPSSTVMPARSLLMAKTNTPNGKKLKPVRSYFET